MKKVSRKVWQSCLFLMGSGYFSPEKKHRQYLIIEAIISNNWSNLRDIVKWKRLVYIRIISIGINKDIFKNSQSTINCRTMPKALSENWAGTEHKVQNCLELSGNAPKHPEGCSGSPLCFHGVCKVLPGGQRRKSAPVSPSWNISSSSSCTFLTSQGKGRGRVAWTGTKLGTQWGFVVSMKAEECV